MSTEQQQPVTAPSTVDGGAEWGAGQQPAPKGKRSAKKAVVALAAAGVAGTVLVACAVGTQPTSSDSSTSDTSSTGNSSTSDSSSSSSSSSSDYSGSVSSDSGSSSSGQADASTGSS